jgi:hypothetical protein
MPEIETFISPELEWPGTSLTDYLQAAGVAVSMAESGVPGLGGQMETRIVADRDVTKLMAAFVAPPPPLDTLTQVLSAVKVALTGTEAEKAIAAEALPDAPDGGSLWTAPALLWTTTYRKTIKDKTQ